MHNERKKTQIVIKKGKLRTFHSQTIVSLWRVTSSTNLFIMRDAFVALIDKAVQFGLNISNSNRKGEEIRVN